MAGAREVPAACCRRWRKAERQRALGDARCVATVQRRKLIGGG
jgi:hypothetical protein